MVEVPVIFREVAVFYTPSAVRFVDEGGLNFTCGILDEAFLNELNDFITLSGIFSSRFLYSFRRF